ncbi:MAG: hypothetical protein LBK60_08610, partial [Verrucomicrobiales bacterium]|nr:hypothetical protein [Verrucomicrobiales bacterium]
MLKCYVMTALTVALLSSPVVGQVKPASSIKPAAKPSATASGTMATSGTAASPSAYPEILVQATRLEGAPFQGGVTSSVVTAADIEANQYRTLQ